MYLVYSVHTIILLRAHFVLNSRGTKGTSWYGELLNTTLMVICAEAGSVVQWWSASLACTHLGSPTIALQKSKRNRQRKEGERERGRVGREGLILSAKSLCHFC